MADTGSVYSLIPHSSSSPPSGPRLVSADEKPIACWGACTRTIRVAGRDFTWRFLLAAVAFPIVGADFLRSFKLMVDLAGMRLVHSQAGWHVPLTSPPAGSTFAAVGIQLAITAAPACSCALKIQSLTGEAADSTSSEIQLLTGEKRQVVSLGPTAPACSRPPKIQLLAGEATGSRPSKIQLLTGEKGQGATSSEQPARGSGPGPQQGRASLSTFTSHSGGTSGGTPSRGAGATCGSVPAGTQGGPPNFQALLERYPAVLNVQKDLPPTKHEVEHVISTRGRPVAGRYRRLDPERLAAARKEFAELERQGVVRRSSSSWASPLHMVRKADGTWRPCGDFRRLNLQTEEDRYTCPNMADLTSRLEGCNIFSKLDLRKGYHQVPVEASSVPKTAIITPFGLFEYLRMPFGLRNAGQTFQRMMDQVLQGLDYCFCYLDDVLVASATPEEHVQHLEQTLQRLEQHGLVLNGEKCVLGVAEVEYLGHVVSARGIRPMPDRVQAIQKYPRPGTVQHLQSFLGMANFYRRFIPAAAQVLKPLTDALRGGQRTKLEWTQEMEGAFLGVKQKLVEAVELAHPDPQAPLVLAVDASNTHVGGVLQQADRRGALRPLGFFSVKLDKAQLKYSTFDRELLACFLAIRHFRWCVEGRPLRVLTDHKPLTFALHRVSDAWSARQQRQLSFIAEYTSDIKHVPGVENVVADALSRPTCAVLPSQEGKVDLARLAEAQSTCKETQQWRERPGTQQVTVGEHVLLCDGSTGALRPVVPGPWRRAVFHSVHDLAHAGTRATRRMLTSRFVWRQCAADVAAWCRECQQCARGKVTRQEVAPVEPIPVPSTPYTHVHVDLVGPLPASSKGHTYLLTMVDRTTRWPEVVPLNNISAQVVADAFVDTWVARFGVPSTVTTDRGTQFTGSTWQCLCRTLGVKHVTTTAYHPQANGLVERFHRQLKAALRARSGGKEWLEHLPWVLLGLRTAPKEEANVSAAEAALGSPLQLPGQPLPVDRPNVQEGGRPGIPSTVKRSYAEVAAGPPSWPGEGDLVYVRDGQPRGPLAPTYSGPYRVLEQKGKALRILVGEKEDWVAVERTKRHTGAAHVEPAQPPRRGRPPRRASADEDS